MVSTSSGHPFSEKLLLHEPTLGCLNMLRAVVPQMARFQNETFQGLVHSSDISNVPMTEDEIKKLYRIGQVSVLLQH